MCVCESPMKDHLTNDYNFKVSSAQYLEKRFVSVHPINHIYVHVLIFLWLLFNHTAVS